MLLTQIQLLATETQMLAQTQNDTGPEFGKASPFGLVVIVALLIGTALLIRSMNGRLKKLPPSFDPSDPVPDQAADEGTDRAAVDRPSGHTPRSSEQS